MNTSTHSRESWLYLRVLFHRMLLIILEPPLLRSYAPSWPGYERGMRTSESILVVNLIMVPKSMPKPTYVACYGKCH